MKFRLFKFFYFNVNSFPYFNLSKTASIKANHRSFTAFQRVLINFRQKTAFSDDKQLAGYRVCNFTGNILTKFEMKKQVRNLIIF